MNVSSTRLRRISRRLLSERRTAHPPVGGHSRRASDGQPKHGWQPAVRIAVGVALLDWATKFAVASWVPLDGFREVVPGRVAFWHVRNRAMILGLWDYLPLTGRKALALVAAVLAVLVVVQIVGRAHRLARNHQGWAWLFVGLICGGMAGNLGERVIHWGVTDYLSFRWGEYWLPPGNVADIALFAAIPLAIPVIVFELMARAGRGRTHPQPSSRAAPSTPP